MSTTLTPLGDGQFFDIGFVSPNNWGIEIEYQTDVLTGAIPANIPNPRGSTAFTEQVGCCLEIPVYVPEVVIPEPGYSLLVVMVLGLWMRRGRWNPGL
jgi:hypothetical protein